MKSVGKVLLTVFFDVQSPLLVEFLKHRKSINSDMYCETLRRLSRSIKNKRPGLLTKGVVLFHDNARPHVSIVTQMELDNSNGRRWKIRPTVRTCRPVTSISLVHGRNTWKGSASTRTTYSRTL
ncbi:histone-lysine N-methyltransferase SETMAR [Trichonephila clavipes]|nr:histone-lysine N-methyltransferase SETMAR [Trichonephila clavipes]